MTDTELLKGKIDASGYRMKFIAERLGITYQGLIKKINNETEFKASEIQALYKLLGLSKSEREQIFFCS